MREEDDDNEHTSGGLSRGEGDGNGVHGARLCYAKLAFNILLFCCFMLPFSSWSLSYLLLSNASSSFLCLSVLSRCYAGLTW